MFGPSAILVSGSTVRSLTFRRALVTEDATSGEQLASYDSTDNQVPQVAVVADVQERDMSRLHNSPLISTYLRVYDLIISGTPDIKRNDRVVLDGVDCVVESANGSFGDHTEVIAGQRRV